MSKLGVDYNITSQLATNLYSCIKQDSINNKYWLEDVNGEVHEVSSEDIYRMMLESTGSISNVTLDTGGNAIYNPNTSIEENVAPLSELQRAMILHEANNVTALSMQLANSGTIIKLTGNFTGCTEFQARCGRPLLSSAVERGYDEYSLIDYKDCDYDELLSKLGAKLSVVMSTKKSKNYKGLTVGVYIAVQLPKSDKCSSKEIKIAGVTNTDLTDVDTYRKFARKYQCILELFNKNIETGRLSNRLVV